MKRSMSFAGRAACVLLAAACTTGRGGDGESYRVGGDPWATKVAGEEPKAGSKPAAAEEAGKPVETATAPAAEPKVAAAATGVSDGAATGTVLEQLDAAKRRVTELETEGRRLAAEVASQAGMIEGLKRDNENLAALAAQTRESQSVVDGELESLRAKLKENEQRTRQLADDLLAERIKRVRVERALIMAKVSEVESQGEGN